MDIELKNGLIKLFKNYEVHFRDTDKSNISKYFLDNENIICYIVSEFSTKYDTNIINYEYNLKSVENDELFLLKKNYNLKHVIESNYLSYLEIIT
jgi:hypothetical protein